MLMIMKEVRKVCQESSGNATLSVKNYLRAALKNLEWMFL